MKNAVILATDKNYVKHVIYNINNIKSYNQDIDIIVLSDKINSEIIKKELKDFNVLFHEVNVLKINEGAFYLKYYIFDKFFKQWENILYIDCDTMIFSNLDKIFNLLDENNKMFVDHETCDVLKFFTSGCPRNQDNDGIYFELLKEDSINEQGFNSGIILYKSCIIEDSTIQKLHDLHEKYFNINKHVESGTDQPIINLLFAKIAKQMPNNKFAYFGDMTDETIITHFCRWHAPWVNDQYGSKIGMKYVDYYNNLLNLNYTRKTVFHIEDRGEKWIFHWITYMLAGLRHIGKDTSRFGTGGGGSFEQNAELYNSTIVKEPYYLYISKTKNFINYQQESLDLIKDKFITLNKEDIQAADIVINNYGEEISDNPFHISSEGYLFLRNLFLRNINKDKFKNKKFYISRSRSHLLEGNKLDNNAKRRQIINEKELSLELAKFDINTIFLEDFSFKEKIEIFNTADTIISPNSGGLTFSIFSDKNTKIVEINAREPAQISHQYKSQCSALDIPYYIFYSDKYDSNDNIDIDVNSFLNFLKNNKII